MVTADSGPPASYFRISFSILASMLVSAVLMSFLHTHGKFILTEYLAYYLWFIPPILLIEVVYFRFLRGSGEENVFWQGLIPGLVLFLFLLIALCSSLNEHRWFYFIEWRHGHVPGFHYFHAGIIQFIFLTQLLIPLFLLFRKKTSLITALVLIIFQILCLAVFFQKTGGHALYRDDHACFIYRIWEFIRTCPQFLNYNPDWNAGVYDFSGVTTGAVSLGFLFWPLWKLFPVEAVYTPALAISFIVMVPFLYVFCLRIIGGSWTQAWCAGIMAIGVSQYYFLWMLRYGTPGALLTAAFLGPFASCVFRVIWLDKREWWLALMLVLSAFFLVLWPPGIMMGCGVFIALILSVFKWSWKKILFLLICFALFILLYFPIMKVLFQPSMMHAISNDFSCGGNFVRESIFNYQVLARGWRHLGNTIKEGNPLLIFFGLGGIFFLPQKKIRYWFIPILVFLILLTGWGREINNELQLTRTAIPMFFIAVIPAGLWLGQLLEAKNIRLILVKAALIALLIMSGWSCMKIYKNRSLIRYSTIPPDICAMTGWIRENVPADGRILLAGPAIHAYGGGHAETLPYLSGREMLSADYVQFETAGRVDYFPPDEFRKTKDGLFKYMDLYNVTHVIAWDEPWKDVFRVYPDHYEEIITFDGKTIFKVNRSSCLFLKGEGEVKADFNLIQVHTDNASDDIVIKYNWLEGLKAPAPVEIYPFDAGYGIKFIGIHPHGQEDITIRYKN